MLCAPVNDPFEQLIRSHRRLEEALRALAAAANEEPLDEVTARDVADFLARQVRRHEADEEESLFPRLATIAEVAPVIDRLRVEHAAHVALHAQLERALESTPTPEEVRRVAAALEDAYRTHLDIEEAVLFPAARRALNAQDLAAMVDEMQARRGRAGGRRHDRG
jgi:hemerythrin-like domain-containing protein